MYYYLLRRKQSSAIKQLLEPLFLAIKMYTGFTTDGICMNTMCAVYMCIYIYIYIYILIMLWLNPFDLRL